MGNNNTSQTQEHLFKRYIAQASNYPPFTIDVEKGEGVYIWDKAGKKYMDFIASICVNNVGHRNPAVLDAISKQAEKFLHIMVYGEFIQQPQLDFAQKLCSLLPNNLQRIFFVNSGSEAIEGAIKLARLYNKRKNIVSFKNSYHGSTMGAMSVLGNANIQEAFKPLLPNHIMLNFNNVEELSKITEETCCVVTEIIQSGAGMNESSCDFMLKLRNKCDEVGALLIFDEIQSGFGRCGRLFAFEHYNITPDILCVAKGMGGGMPLGGFVASEKLMDLLNNEHPLLGHASTFGGHPLSCAAALAALNIISEKDFLSEVERKGEKIRNLLKDVETIDRISGKGLFLSLHFKNEEITTKITEYCIANGLITFWLLFNHQAIALTPPLTITDEEIELGIEILKKSIEQALD